MKKLLLTTLSAACLSVLGIAQAVLPTSWNFATTTLPTGWTSSGSGFLYYAGSGNPAPAAKFSLAGDKLIINFNSTPGILHYDLVGNPSPNTTWAGTFTVEESVNGTTWTTVGTAYTALTTTYTSFTNTLIGASRYVRFNFTTKTNGNVGLDNVSIAVGVSTAQEINVKQGNTTVVNGGTYTVGSPVSTPVTVALKVQNLGTVTALQVSGATLSGPAAADYSVTTTTPFTVNATDSTTLNVSFIPSVAGTRNAVLSIASDDANGNNPYLINLNGIGGNLATEPTAQPTTMTFPIIKSFRIGGSFTAASPAPDGYLVLRRTGSAITDVPVDGTVYQRGDMIGSSKVVYSSNALGFMPNDIKANTQYYFAVYAYNGTGTFRNYLTTSPLTGNVTSSGSMQPTSYYSAISTSSTSLVTDLHTLVHTHTIQLYGSYGPLMAAALYSRDTTGNQRVITCVYSGENKVYTEPFDWVTENFSREHTYCQSWQATVNCSNFQNLGEYNDYHMITPTDQNNCNAIRSNYPLGVVVGTPTYTYLGAKLGNDANGHKVWEPRDSDKGDAARCMMYECITYTGETSCTPANTTTTYGGTPAPGTNIWSLPTICYNPGVNYAQDQNVLKQWNTQDPPDNFEIARNDYVDSLQNNRNPFIDHPEYMCYIDFSNMTALTSQNCGTTGITENKDNSLVSVSPNPNNGSFMVNYTAAKNEKISVKLIDVVGHVVYANETMVNSGTNPIEMNVQNITKGIYFLEFSTEKEKQVEKVVVQ
jgi:endonuclease I